MPDEPTSPDGSRIVELREGYVPPHEPLAKGYIPPREPAVERPAVEPGRPPAPRPVEERRDDWSGYIPPREPAPRPPETQS